MAKPHSPPPATAQPAAPKDPQKAAQAAKLGDLIGRELKAMFDDVVAEPVPEKFRTLLEELERKSRNP